ncbi:hypothetical protein ACLOJK_024231 [Asimina triloba]
MRNLVRWLVGVGIVGQRWIWNLVRWWLTDGMRTDEMQRWCLADRSGRWMLAAGMDTEMGFMLLGHSSLMA